MASIAKDLPPLPPAEGTGTNTSSSVASQQQLEASTTTGKASSQGLFRRLTNKLRSPSTTAREPLITSPDSTPPTAWSGADASNASPQHKRRPTRTRMTPMENSWMSPEQRMAALRERGLLPSQAQPLRDGHEYKLPLSEQEQQLDKRTIIPPRQSQERESEAEKIAEAWMKKNMGIAYRARSRSSEEDQGQAFSSLQQEGEAAPHPPSSGQAAYAVDRSPSIPAPTSGHPAFLAREPQARKLLDAMKNHRPPPTRATTAPRSRRNPHPDSSEDSESD